MMGAELIYLALRRDTPLVPQSTVDLSAQKVQLRGAGAQRTATGRHSASGLLALLSGVPTVHLLGKRTPREGIVVAAPRRSSRDTAASTISPRRTTSAACARSLKSKKVKFREQIIPRTGGQQIFLYIPTAGVELNFPPP